MDLRAIALKKQLLSQYDSWIKQSIPSIKITKFDHFDFTVPASEQFIEIHHLFPKTSDHLLQFWVKSVQSRDWDNPEQVRKYSLEVLCERLTLAKLENLVANYTRSLMFEQSLFLPNNFIQGLKMRENWNDLAIIAEFEQEYFAFYWTTTA